MKKRTIINIWFFIFLLIIVSSCMCFVHFDRIMQIVLLIREYQSKKEFSENQFDNLFSKAGEIVFNNKNDFIGSTKNNVYGCQFKISIDELNSGLSKLNISKQNSKRDIFDRINEYVMLSELSAISQYKNVIYQESAVFVKDISDLFIRGPVFIFTNTYKDDILLVTVCFIQI